MTVKRKDFQKAAAFLQEFLLKLSDDMECAELRDSLNLVLLYMQKYYKSLQCRSHEKNIQHSLNMSMRGLSPLTPFVDAPDKFQWKWINLDSQRLTSSMSMNESANFTLPPIIQSAKQGDIKHMLHLLHRDPSCVEDRDGIGRTALAYTVHFHQIDALKILLQNGADVNATAHDGSTCLHQACHDSSYISLHILLEFGADLNIQDSLGRYPIHWASTTPSNDCLRLLIQYKCDIKVCDKEGMTASMWACRLDHIKHLEILSQADHTENTTVEDIERDGAGRTWMHWSIRRTEPLECLQTLLTEETAKIKDVEGKTVLLLAAEQGSLVSCRVIVDIAGDGCIRDVDDQHRTALHLATMGGHGDVVNFLLECQADLNAVDKYNATPWDYARNRQLHYCQLILMSHQRQRLGSNRSTPYGFDPSVLHGDITVDDDYMTFYNQLGISTPHKPITPPTPNPPKRPRRSMNGQHTLTRRANSLPHTPKPEPRIGDRSVASAGDGHNVLMNGPERTYTEDSLPLGMSTPYSNSLYMTGSEMAEGEGHMEVSDEGEAQDPITPHPPPTHHHIPTPPTTPLHASQQNPLLAVTPPTTPKHGHGLTLVMPPPPNQHGIPQPSPPITVTPPAYPKQSQRQLWQPSPPPTPQRPSSPVYGMTTNTRQPLTPLHRPTVNQHISGTTQPHDHLDGSSLRSNEDHSKKSEASHANDGSQMHDGSRPDSASSQEQVSNTVSSVDTVRTVIAQRFHGEPPPPGMLEGKKIPPPVLTPLKNAPQPPIMDESLPHRTKRKKKKKRSSITSPQNNQQLSPVGGTLPDFGPTVKRAPSAAPRAMTRTTSSMPHGPPGTQSTQPTQGVSGVPPPPQVSDNSPRKREARTHETSNDTPPMISGHAYPLRPDRASAKPRYTMPPPPHEDSPPSTSDKLYDETEEHATGPTGDANTVSEDGDGVGPLIPPPQAFRGASGRPQQHSRPLSVSVPLDGQSFRALSAAGKPPIPRGHASSATGHRGQAGSASAQRGHYRRSRVRPNTGNV